MLYMYMYNMLFFFFKAYFCLLRLAAFCVHMIIVQGRNINSAVYYIIFEHKLHSPSMYDRCDAYFMIVP